MRKKDLKKWLKSPRTQDVPAGLRDKLIQAIPDNFKPKSLKKPSKKKL